MPQDPELNRLKAVQDAAFQRRQAAYDALQVALQRLADARYGLDQAHQIKQQAYGDMQAAWDDYQETRQHNGPQIDWLNAQQEHTFQSMRNAFNQASAAHAARLGAAARSYATQGHQYEAEAKAYVDERRELVQEIRDAKQRHADTEPTFQRAKGWFEEARYCYEAAKADHVQAEAEFERAKAGFGRTVAAFKARLTEVGHGREGSAPNEDQRVGAGLKDASVLDKISGVERLTQALQAATKADRIAFASTIIAQASTKRPLVGTVKLIDGESLAVNTRLAFTPTRLDHALTKPAASNPYTSAVGVARW